MFMCRHLTEKRILVGTGGRTGHERRFGSASGKIRKMKSAALGSPTLGAEVTNISPQGVWMLVNGAEKFLPFEKFPWFRSAAVSGVYQVEMPSGNHLYWPELDIDLAVESIDHPEHFPLLSKLDSTRPVGPV